MKKNFIYFLFLLALISCKDSSFDRIIPEDNDEFPAPAPPATPLPYPLDSAFQVKSITSAETERIRLNQNFSSSDFIPTGWFAEEGSDLIVNLRRLKGDYYPVLIIGTYNRTANPDADVKTYTLTPGNNSIKVEKSGLIYIRYNGELNNNESIVKFVSGVKPAPFYRAGKTSKEEWKGMLNTYTSSPDAVLFGGKIIIVVNRRTALDNIAEDQELLLKTANNIWEWEEDFAGLDNSSALHTRNLHNHLMTESNNPEYYMAAFHYGTFYNASSAAHMLVKPKDINSWGPWHEIGHHHQQASYLWTDLMEVTVNLYSLYVQEKLGREPELKTRGTWPSVVSYLALPTASKNFDGIEDPFIKLAMFRQLWLAFGSDFYTQLHKVTREKKLANSATDLQKKEFFMLRACEISGRNLTNFFQKWGMTGVSTIYPKITALGLPIPSSDLTKLQD